MQDFFRCKHVLLRDVGGWNTMAWSFQSNLIGLHWLELCLEEVWNDLERGRRGLYSRGMTASAVYVASSHAPSAPALWDVSTSEQVSAEHPV
eukprot:23538-Prorocentrum_minimum.AAC.1